ncbi:N-acetyltransferase 10 [Glugoides intestinalis]
MPKIASDYVQKLFAHQVKNNHRTVIVLIGNDSKQQIPNLHENLSGISQLNNIVWCFKNPDTYMDREYKKIRKIADDASDLAKWIKIQDPDYISYKENNRILGRTCDMLILQDFEALTPNMIACAIETVRGGGVIILLFDQEKSIKEIIARKSEMVLEAVGQETIQRFNRRLFKSLVQNSFVIFLDSKLRVMDITKEHPLEKGIEYKTYTRTEKFSEDPLLEMCKTKDQFKVLSELINRLEKKDQSITSVLAARGRGKSVALGLAIAKAIDSNFSSILISALFIENVQSIFDFIINGLNRLGYKKMQDYKVIYAFEGKKRLIKKIEIIRGYRRVVDYIHPFEELTVHSNLLVIDEAASIPLPHLKKLLNSRLVFMASTINGYEGTGRVFRTKLAEYSQGENTLEMVEPIRYSLGDEIEKWLYQELLLEPKTRNIQKSLIPADCTLHYVNKDALFSGTPKTEESLEEIFSLFISSHYRNSPNDLQILSDSPNHELFVLMASSRVICAIQVSFEGKCDENSFKKEGNLIPWVIFDNYFDNKFLESFGARIVRIAVHPNTLSMGYGSMVISKLTAFLEASNSESLGVAFEDKSVLFHQLSNIRTPKISWIGSSFGVTERLLNFWKKAGFNPICIKQTPSKTTGEFSTVVLKACDNACSSYLVSIEPLFSQRFVPLLSYSFRDMPPTLVLSLIYSSERAVSQKQITFSPDELQRLRMFSKGMLDVKCVLDVLPEFAKFYFYKKSPNAISIISQIALVMIGCQNKTMEDVAKHLDIELYKATNSLSTAVSQFLEIYSL